ncbi:MAG: peptidase, partial [Pedosphaera sp.]|nr:peptidase [Pedosphaera sp.]
MNTAATVTLVVLMLILARWAAQFWLARLNQRNVLAHAEAIPEAFNGIIDDATYAKSVQYTLAKSRLGQIEMTYDAVILAIVLFSGLLPWGFGLLTGWLGTSAWAMAAFLFAMGLVLSLPGLPFEYYGQFRLEERFGFN